MKTANSRVIQHGQYDAISIKRTYALVPVAQLKVIAQSLHDSINWYGGTDYDIFYQCCIEVIHISEPSFETHYTPAI